jgi:ACT domain-containing protein
MNILRANQIERMKILLNEIVGKRNMLLVKIDKMDLKIGEIYADITKINQNNLNPNFLFKSSRKDVHKKMPNIISFKYISNNNKSC